MDTAITKRKIQLAMLSTKVCFLVNNAWGWDQLEKRHETPNLIPIR